MNIKRVILSIGTAILLFPQTSHAQTSSPKPKIGYLLPAGGQHGTTVKIMLGGARITNSPEILVQDKGIRAKVEHACTTPRTERPRANERAAMRQAVDLAKRGAAITGELRDRLNDRPLLWPLRNPKLKPTQDEMQRITYEYLTDRQRVQASRDLAQTVLISLAIPANTKPGRHELRLRTPFGISDPFYFFVGQCPETLETEPGTEQQPMAPPLRLPICINGQIFPGDIDRYRFQAKAGQTLSLTAAARELKPFIADAVPGWFEAMITLYDPKGKEAAFSDCTQFRPDPTRPSFTPSRTTESIPSSCATHSTAVAGISSTA